MAKKKIAKNPKAQERHDALKAKLGNTQQWKDMEATQKNRMTVTSKYPLFGKKRYTEQEIFNAQVSRDTASRLKKYGPVTGQLDAEVQSLFGKKPKVSRTSRSVSAPNLGKARANKALSKQLTNQSFLLEIQGLQSAKDALLSTAADNARKQQYELSVSLEEAAQQYASVSSAQRAAAGASGLMMHSQSFLDVYAEAANQYTTQTNRLKQVTAINQQSLYKESLMKAEEYNIEINSVSLQQRLQNLLIDDN